MIWPRPRKMTDFNTFGHKINNLMMMMMMIRGSKVSSGTVSVNCGAAVSALRGYSTGTFQQ